MFCILISARAHNNYFDHKGFLALLVHMEVLLIFKGPDASHLKKIMNTIYVVYMHLQEAHKTVNNFFNLLLCFFYSIVFAQQFQEL